MLRRAPPPEAPDGHLLNSLRLPVFIVRQGGTPS